MRSTIPSGPRLPGARTRVLMLALLALAAGASEAAAQSDDRPPSGTLRVGLTFGSVGFLGVTTEYQFHDYSVELTLGTISFREIAVSLAGKRYFSDGRLRPAIGLGLWSLSAWTEDGSGSVLILRLPLAADWNWAGGHATGVEVTFNRALAVNRLDPEDETPPNTSIVPFPGLYYRFGFRR